MQSSLRLRSWEWILNRPQGVHKRELADYLGTDCDKAHNVLCDLLRKQCIEVEKRYRTDPNAIYKPIEGAKPNFSRSRPNPHKPTCARQKIWQAIRFLSRRPFSVSDVAAASEQSEDNINVYISALVRYGYMTKLNGNNSVINGKRVYHACRYQLTIDSGRRYPVIRRSELFDQNLNKTTPKGKTFQEVHGVM